MLSRWPDWKTMLQYDQYVACLDMFGKIYGKKSSELTLWRRWSSHIQPRTLPLLLAGSWLIQQRGRFWRSIVGVVVLFFGAGDRNKQNPAAAVKWSHHNNGIYSSSHKNALALHFRPSDLCSFPWGQRHVGQLAPVCLWRWNLMEFV